MDNIIYFFLFIYDKKIEKNINKIININKRITMVKLSTLKALLSLPLIVLTNGEYYEKCNNPKHISLSFDDGIHENTQGLVDVLNKYGIKGSFFINNLQIVRNPAFGTVVKQMYNEGHIIGSHGFSHEAMEKLNGFNIMREMYDNELIFRELFNVRPRYFRPPYFSYNDYVYGIVTDHFGYDFIATNAMSNDWDGISAQAIVDYMVNKLVTEPTTGKITIQHDTEINNIEALEMFIHYGMENNYTFVDLTQCLGHDNAYIQDNYYGPNMLNGINLN